MILLKLLGSRSRREMGELGGQFLGGLEEVTDFGAVIFEVVGAGSS